MIRSPDERLSERSQALRTSEVFLSYKFDEEGDKDTTTEVSALRADDLSYIKREDGENSFNNMVDDSYSDQDSEEYESDHEDEEEDDDDDEEEEEDEESDDGDSEDESSEEETEGGDSSDSDESEIDEEVEILTFKVLVTHSDEIRGYSLPLASVYSKLVKSLTKEYGGVPKLSYIDSENDPISVKSQKDVMYVLRDYRLTASVVEGKQMRSLRLQALFNLEKSNSNSLERSVPAYHTVSPSSSEVIEDQMADMPQFKTTLGSSTQGKTELLWQKGEMLGAGSYGKVYRCIDSNSGEIIAVKEVKLRRGSKYKEQALAMQQELMVLSALDHPNIIRYLGAEYSKQQLRIFLELAPEGSVKDAIHEFGAFSEPVVRKYMRDILNGLSFLHSKRFVHRDIKPTNMLINKNTVKLADFGCAVSSLVDASGKSAGVQGVIGTTVYMSPEVMAGSDDVVEGEADDSIAKRYGRKADVWSMAVSCVEMSIGEMPFRTAASAIYRVCVTKEFPTLPSHFSADAHSFINRCFVEDPSERADCEELLGLAFSQTLSMDETRALQASKTNRQTASTLLMNLSSFNPLDGSQDLSQESMCLSTDLSKSYASPFLSSSMIGLGYRFDQEEERKYSYDSDTEGTNRRSNVVGSEVGGHVSMDESVNRSTSTPHKSLEASPIEEKYDEDSFRIIERKIRTAPSGSRSGRYSRG